MRNPSAVIVLVFALLMMNLHGLTEGLLYGTSDMPGRWQFTVLYFACVALVMICTKGDRKERS